MEMRKVGQQPGEPAGTGFKEGGVGGNREASKPLPGHPQPDRSLSDETGSQEDTRGD